MVGAEPRIASVAADLVAHLEERNKAQTGKAMVVGNNHAVYPAASFAAQVLSIMEASPRQFSEQLRRRVHGAFKNPDDMRGLRLEISAATHFARRARKLA